MSAAIDATHDAALTSWVESANDAATDFPLQNLPYGRFKRAGVEEPWRFGVAIGSQVLELATASRQCPWPRDVEPLLSPLAAGDLGAFLSLGVQARRTLRAALSHALAAGSEQSPFLDLCLVPQADVELSLPLPVRDYTDFYTGIHHATTVGKLMRPDNPLLPNYKWVPVGYHGRASSVVVSGTAFHRPRGQLKGANHDVPIYDASRRLDYELELGAVLAGGNALGEPIPIERAEESLAGLVLLNDWSARDVQGWEYQPLGPFLAKSFATSISPWLVTMEALEPFRVPFVRPDGDPQPLPYLDSPANRERGAIDLQLEVWFDTATMRERGDAPMQLSRANFKDAYWTLAQLVAHHSSNGCNLGTGDLLGTGTQSGPGDDQGGSLLELSAGGKRTIPLPEGTMRTFLEDGDRVILKAFAEREGRRRIGFGECAGTVLPAR
jgi:fumarylacetoacetase